jgi:ribosome-associated protein
VLLYAQPVCGFADYFVVCSGDSDRQLGAIDDEIEHSLKKEGISLYHREGKVDSGWVLLDYGSVIVHIFAPAEREYYQPDKLWGAMNTVLRIE